MNRANNLKLLISYHDNILSTKSNMFFREKNLPNIRIFLKFSLTNHFIPF